jgi:hypothetical protein
MQVGHLITAPMVQAVAAVGQVRPDLSTAQAVALVALVQLIQLLDLRYSTQAVAAVVLTVAAVALEEQAEAELEVILTA